MPRCSDDRGTYTFNDWEMKEVNDFLLSLSRKKVQTSLEDKVVWVEEKHGTFSVKSLFKALSPATSFYFPTNMVWQPKLQLRICFFAQEAA